MPLKSEVREADLLIYGRACPNCGGFISDTRLKFGVPCTSCLRTLPKDKSAESIYSKLRKARRLKAFRLLYLIKKKYEEMVDFFKKCVGNEPWSIQKLWLKRIAKEASFAMIAPTGIGKTTFGIAVALYLAIKGYKTYIIVPTTTLAIQLEKRIEEMSVRAGVIIKALVIHSRLKKKEKESREVQLNDPDGFDILVTTSNYLLRNADRIVKHNFKLIFVDDVDAVLRGSKAINYILYMAGFNDDDIETGLKIIRLKRELAYRGGNPELLSKILKLEDMLEKKRKKLGKIVVIASATGNPRGTRVKLFRELMGFEIGARPEFIRNIVDCYLKPEKDRLQEVVELVKKLGSGGLVYVPVDAGREYAEEVAKELRKAGVPAEAIHSRNIQAIDAFVTGELRVLTGVATYYGVLVRGIDLPEVIRYAIFIGVPRHKVGLRLKEIKPQDVLRLLPLVRSAVEDEELRKRIDRHIARIRRALRRLGGFALQRIDEVLRGEREPETAFEHEFIDALNLLRELVSSNEVLKGVKENPEVAVVEENGELYVLIPDAPTYIQASGRTSRLYLGGISKGLSIVLVDDDRLLKGLERRLKWIIEDFEFKSLEEVDLKKVLEEVDSNRSIIRKLKKGEVPKDLLAKKGRVLELKTALLVVESPNKARTIARFFGRPSVREYGRLRVYEVNLGNYTLLITASGGHIYDLITDVTDVPNIYGVAYIAKKREVAFIPIYTTLKRCMDKGHQFTSETSENSLKCPICGSPNIFDARVTVDAIRDVALEVDEVLVGTDPDTEGEKIAFDIVSTVLPVNNNVKRIEFHEVTKRAIINAVSSPRGVDLNLVRAQLVRRIEDRWLGFSLSRLLQTEFWQRFCKEISSLPINKESTKWYLTLCSENPREYRNLSAGRVQTPVLGWIIQAYEEHTRSKRLYVIVELNGVRLDIPVPEDLRKELRLGPKSVTGVAVTVSDTKEEVTDLNPLPPYTTDSVLADISSILKIPAPRAMQILQDLFELGFITYHRTDSTRVSEVGVAVAREYLKEQLGEDFDKYYSPRTWGTGGAHEAIRPTRPIDAGTLRSLISEGIIEPVRTLTKAHYRVYDLIFRRFIASQTKPAKVKKLLFRASAKITLRNGKEVSIGEKTTEVYTETLFDGFLRYYPYIKPKRAVRPGTYMFKEGEFEVRERHEKPLHTQATIIKLMKEREIGRPSTYAKIIDTLFKRGYVTFEKSTRRGIVPLLLGKKVYEYLVERYSELVSEERTRALEKKMKAVEEGSVDYKELIRELNKELSQNNLVPGVE